MTLFSLFETMRYEPGTGIVRLPLHLERLRNSADLLGFPYDEASVSDALDRAVSGADTMRVRLELDRSGRTGITQAPFTPLPDDARWTLRIAHARLDSADPLLPHKTTRRQAYAKARGEFTSAEADEVVLLNERGELCEGTITSLFLSAGIGPLKTPPLSSGLLAGVLRAEMLQRELAIETVLYPEDLETHDAFVGNSLRGLIHARLA